ncbi:MAG: hypothetical protein ABIK77_03325 [candidate division WOR-3 bacterium]
MRYEKIVIIDTGGDLYFRLKDSAGWTAGELKFCHGDNYRFYSLEETLNFLNDCSGILVYDGEKCYLKVNKLKQKFPLINIKLTNFPLEIYYKGKKGDLFALFDEADDNCEVYSEIDESGIEYFKIKVNASRKKIDFLKMKRFCYIKRNKNYSDYWCFEWRSTSNNFISIEKFKIFWDWLKEKSERNELILSVSDDNSTVNIKSFHSFKIPIEVFFLIKEKGDLNVLRLLDYFSEEDI